MQKSILYLVLFAGIFSSCVTPKIHNALIAENDAAQVSLKNKQKTKKNNNNNKIIIKEK